MDITFYNPDKTVFNCRTCGVIIDNNRILLHRMKNDDYWSLVGGRVQMIESSDSALIREFKEELGENVKIIRLLWIVENFFKLEEKEYHEIAMIYLISLPKDSLIIKNEEHFFGLEGEMLIYKWFDFEELHALNIKPSFLKDKLIFLPNRTNHIIHREEIDFELV